MIINHNIAALNTYNQLSSNNATASKNMEKLSSGLRINRAADDAAGLAISESMRGQIRGLEQAQRNAQDGVSVIQTADGALQEAQNVLQRMRELSVQASNDTNGTTDRAAIKTEIDELSNQLTNIANNTKFNGKTLLKGDVAGSGGAGDTFTFQVGANKDETFALNFVDVKLPDGTTDATKTNGINLTQVITNLNTDSTSAGALDVADTDAAQKTIEAIDTAIESISSGRATLGAAQNRLEYSMNVAANSAENLTAAESRIRDVDMAQEMMKFTKNNILSQAAQSMLAQANQQPQGVLQLLR
jgi:flagellin